MRLTSFFDMFARDRDGLTAFWACLVFSNLVPNYRVAKPFYELFSAVRTVRVLIPMS